MYARRRIKDRGIFAERSVQLLPSFHALRYPFFLAKKELAWMGAWQRNRGGERGMRRN